MLLAIDIGNTNFVLGIFEGSSLLAHWRLATDPKTTADEHGVLCLNLLTRSGRVPEQITGAIISSVVPALTGTFETMVETYFHRTPLVVSADMDMGLTLKYTNPKEIGSDRIVNAAAAFHKYRRDLIIVDSGTATTFCAVTKDGAYLGGVIAPGLGISAEALFARAAKLSKVELARPKTVIGTDTAGSIQSFAAKEAVAKALGSGIGDGSWKEIEVLGDEQNAPTLTLYGMAKQKADELGLTTWSVSISHSQSHSVAFVVAMG